MEDTGDIGVEREAAVDVASLHHFLFETDGIARDGRVIRTAVCRPHAVVSIGIGCQMRWICRHHRNICLVEHIRERFNIECLVACRVGIGDICRDELLAPRAIAIVAKLIEQDRFGTPTNLIGTI